MRHIAPLRCLPQNEFDLRGITALQMSLAPCHTNRGGPTTKGQTALGGAWGPGSRAPRKAAAEEETLAYCLSLCPQGAPI